MKFLSVCSGIEAASVAWSPLGWRAWAFAEIEAFPSAVLAHHYPHTPNLGDMTRFGEWPDATIDVLVGGTPCQSFSVAGLRAGLADPRGGLLFTYLAIARRYRPRWVVWENVPGVLSIDAGRAFGSLLGGLEELGYGVAFRVLDAQYFGVPQRRRRVFVVGCAGGWQRAAAVLFERASLSGDLAPRRAAGKVAAGILAARARSGGGLGTDLELDGGLIPGVAPTLAGTANGGGANGPGRDVDSAESLIVMSSGQANAEIRVDGGAPSLTCLHEAPIVAHPPAISFSVKDSGADAAEEVAPTLRAGGFTGSHANGGVMPAVAFKPSHYTRGKDGAPSETAPPLSADADKGDQDPVVATFAEVADPVAANQAKTYTREGSHNFRLSNVAHTATAVRRLTPRECERLQGFPDDYTAIPYRGKPAADGPRYKALGNSMAVPVMRWIGERIALVDAIKVEP